MKAKTAVILVELEDDKVYQVNINTNQVLLFLNAYASTKKGAVQVFDEPIEGIMLGKIVNAT